jgi:hypothetical protein
MPRFDWQPISLLDEANLAIGYPWHFVSELFGEWTLLRLITEGSWSCLGPAVIPCGPDGHVALPLAADRLQIATAAPGALIGKFGGSLASRNDPTPFVIGTRSVVKMPARENAQFYIGINGALPIADNVLARIRLEIRGVTD